MQVNAASSSKWRLVRQRNSSCHPDAGLVAVLDAMKGGERAEQQLRRVAACKLLQMLIKERDADCDTVGVDDEVWGGLTGWRSQVWL
jgi:hypothetical protein